MSAKVLSRLLSAMTSMHRRYIHPMDCEGGAYGPRGSRAKVSMFLWALNCKSIKQADYFELWSWHIHDTFISLSMSSKCWVSGCNLKGVQLMWSRRCMSLSSLPPIETWRLWSKFYWSMRHQEICEGWKQSIQSDFFLIRCHLGYCISCMAELNSAFSELTPFKCPPKWSQID